jgi:N utilization substance protein A
MEITFDTESVRLITVFENLTGVQVKDCMMDNETNTVYYIVSEGKIGLAIGKNGSSVKNVERVLKKNVKIFEFSENLIKFVKNLIRWVNEVKVRKEGEKIIVELKVDKNDKAFVIGRGGKKLKIYKEILRRNHGVEDLIIR